MKPFVVFLLILSLLLAQTQGIRLGKVSSPLQQQKQQDGEFSLLKRSNTDAEETVLLCKDNECTGKLKNRKLVATSISTTKSLSKNVEESKGEELVNGRNVNTLRSWKQKDVPEEHNHDLVEITEMDYSPAKRKPPIHN
ncbi:uncharacterized protein LOC114179477 [Vigna unguiculata]|uniref:Uncharacterized protein n=1 Tax=Vigna unguiculata TaxID=3917 RepID=A0A4D6KR91_VIGUN|nr:uncharacterized protein LOC114179477 [Vigna unguiculata]QCD80566.1 hypothetical protein DEO72_LG2g888 [Vigna unguiculata]